jgi:hypothetical protein
MESYRGRLNNMGKLTFDLLQPAVIAGYRRLVAARMAARLLRIDHEEVEEKRWG